MKKQLRYSDYLVLRENLVDGKIPIKIIKLMSLWMLNFGSLKGFSKDWEPTLGHRMKASLLMNMAEKEEVCKPFLEELKPYI